MISWNESEIGGVGNERVTVKSGNWAGRGRFVKGAEQDALKTKTVPNSLSHLAVEKGPITASKPLKTVAAGVSACRGFDSDRTGRHGGLPLRAAETRDNVVLA